MQLMVKKVSVDQVNLSSSLVARATSKLREGRNPGKRYVAHSLVGSLLCAALLGCCQPNDPNCKNERIGPSGAEVAGIALGVGAVAATAIVIGVHHAHHTLKGCVVDAPGGLQLHTRGGKGAYLLAGSTDGIKAGDLVSVHGEEEKDGKGTTAIARFKVEHLNKDYGHCTSIP